MSMQEYIVAAVVLLAAGYAVRRMLRFFRSTKSGKSDFCAGCSGCSLKQHKLSGREQDGCHKLGKN